MLFEETNEYCLISICYKYQKPEVKSNYTESTLEVSLNRIQ